MSNCSLDNERQGICSVKTGRTGQTPHGIDVKGEVFGTTCLAGRYTSPSSDKELSTSPSNSSVRSMHSTSASLNSTLENPCQAPHNAIIICKTDKGS